MSSKSYPQMQKIPKNWRKVKLGEVADVKTGSSDVKDAVEGGNYPLFDRSMTIKRSDKYLFDDTAIILPGEGREFIPRFFSGKFDLHQRSYAIFPHQKEVHPRYLYYAVLKEKGIFSQWAVGSTVKSLRMPIIKSVEIALPSIQDQKRIASILSAFDDKIELNNKISRTLEQMAQAIFKEWFIENKKLKMKNEKLEEIAEIIKGKKPQNIYNKPRAGNLEYLLIESFTANNRFFTNDNTVPQSENGDSVIVIDGASSGRVFRGRKGAIGSTLAVIKPKPRISREFIFLLLKRAEPQLMKNLTGSAIPHLDKDFLKNYPVSVPTSEIMEKFTLIVRPILQKIVETENENQKLAALRDLLLPKLMSGEIRV